jgi:hypothetical protein
MSRMHSSLIVFPFRMSLSLMAWFSFGRDQELNGYPRTFGGDLRELGHRCLLLLGELRVRAA